MLKEFNTSINARSIYRRLGYKRWRDFRRQIHKAESLIRSGCAGVITQTTECVAIGSGAMREIEDYSLDVNARQLVSGLCAGHKLTAQSIIRNEIFILSMLKKYFESKGVSFEFQRPLGGFIYDALVGDKILVEFDEDHHMEASQRSIDIKKDVVASLHSKRIVRIGLKHDIVDAILTIERHLFSMVEEATDAD